MKATVFDIKKEFYAIQELLEQPLEIDEETGEVLQDNTEIAQELLNELEANKEEKADNICYLISENKMYEDQLKDEVKRLQARAKMFARVQENLKELLEYLLNGEKLKTKNFTISYRKSTSVNIIDESKIPAEFIKVKEEFKIDKKAISKELKEFNQVAGATLEVKQNISIR
jgi:hypothetical protein